jgi:hypothetical protein
MKKPDAYSNFDNMARELLKVQHSEIKAKLDMEKKEKAERKKRKTKRPD